MSEHFYIIYSCDSVHFDLSQMNPKGAWLFITFDFLSESLLTVYWSEED
jgi:hypothetical protein